MNEETTFPTFIGVGGHKCASTWLSECLRAHPDVFMSTPKEIHFFSDNWEKGWKWYIEHFKSSGEYEAIGEFSATYLQKNEAPERIKHQIGNIKIIVSIRDPIERFISHYKHLFRNGSVTKNHLTYEYFQYITKEYPHLLERGIYSSYIKNYIKIFGEENVYTILKDTLDQNPAQEIQKLYKYLEVDPEFIPSILNKQVSPGIIPKIYFLEATRVKTFRFLNRMAPSSINLIRKTRITELYRKFNNKKESLVIDEKVKNILLEYYRNDIIELERLLQVKLDSWKL